MQHKIAEYNIYLNFSIYLEVNEQVTSDDRLNRTLLVIYGQSDPLTRIKYTHLRYFVLNERNSCFENITW